MHIWACLRSSTVGFSQFVARGEITDTPSHPPHYPLVVFFLFFWGVTASPLPPDGALNDRLSVLRVGRVAVGFWLNPLNTRPQAAHFILLKTKISNQSFAAKKKKNPTKTLDNRIVFCFLLYHIKLACSLRSQFLAVIYCCPTGILGLNSTFYQILLLAYVDWINFFFLLKTLVRHVKGTWTSSSVLGRFWISTGRLEPCPHASLHEVAFMWKLIRCLH